MSVQTPLCFDFNGSPTFGDYFPGCNGTSTDYLKAFSSLDPADRLAYLWGPRGVGKSHLLTACCHAADNAGKSACALPLSSFAKLDCDILSGLEGTNLVCLDDIDAIAGRADWERALFALYNASRDAGNTLLVTAKKPPGDLSIDLRDLKSRLAWGVTLKLEFPNDDDKLAAITLHAKRVGLEIKPLVGRYLLTHYARDLPSLLQLIARLEFATLAAKRRLTIPFIKEYLAETGS